MVCGRASSWAAADDTAPALRRLASERVAVFRWIGRATSRAPTDLNAPPMPGCAGHLFGMGGRRARTQAPRPKDDRDLPARRHERLPRDPTHISPDAPRTRGRMTVAGLGPGIGPGIGPVIGTAVVAPTGDIAPFAPPETRATTPRTSSICRMRAVGIRHHEPGAGL